MNSLKITAVVFWVNLLAGCGSLQGFKLLAPESFGMSPVAENVYIERGADEQSAAELCQAVHKAESAILAAFGSVNSKPVVHACVTEGCYESFGGMGSRAKVYGDRILLSPRGLNWHFLAHEWSHAELRSRLSFTAGWHVPRWFDEGVAVAVSEAPEHSEEHWQFLVTTNVPRPTQQELHSLKSLGQWIDAVHRYGEDKNIERKAEGKPELSPVYAAAGHEVRPWLAKAGSDGLLAFIARLNGGENFESAYRTADIAIETDARQAALPHATHPSP
jgi:hypothetical protein